MIQVYTPNIHIAATRGWCLKYVDDAGNAPDRTATARYAWQMERNAGRIRTDTIPENVWVVGWLDFTAGAYTTYGHVFFMKRTGNSYQIYDSEVQGGGRANPYGSINELLAWFGAYSPVYTGWSTHCDGREYAKKEEDMIRDTNHEYNRWANLSKFLRARSGSNKVIQPLSRAEFRASAVGRTWLQAIETLMDNRESSAALTMLQTGVVATKDKWDQQIYDRDKTIKDLKAQLAAKSESAAVSKLDALKKALKDVIG